MSPLVTFEIFRLFVNTLTPDDKYWLPMTSIPVTIWRFSYNNFKRLYLKNESLFVDTGCISEMFLKFRTFWKKRRVS